MLGWLLTDVVGTMTTRVSGTVGVDDVDDGIGMATRRSGRRLLTEYDRGWIRVTSRLSPSRLPDISGSVFDGFDSSVPFSVAITELSVEADVGRVS